MPRRPQVAPDAVESCALLKISRQPREYTTVVADSSLLSRPYVVGVVLLTVIPLRNTVLQSSSSAQFFYFRPVLILPESLLRHFTVLYRCPIS